MARKLFGTDGIRGSANTDPMTAEIALRVGMAAGRIFTRGDHRHTVVIGKDTRLSGYMLEPALASGFTPDTVHIPYRRRVAGGLFAANVDFGDHPVRTRLSGDYPVITVRAILRWLARNGATLREREWRDGQEPATPGPA